MRSHREEVSRLVAPLIGVGLPHMVELDFDRCGVSTFSVGGFVRANCWMTLLSNWTPISRIGLAPTNDRI